MELAEVTETSQYLTFTLDNEYFAIEINKVSEVLDYIKITKVPGVPDFILGVINLRGKVLPVIDLRLKLGLQAGDQTKDTCIIIAEVNMEEKTTKIGVVTDSVEDVIGFSQDQIDPPPKLGLRLSSEFISGMGKQNRNDNFVIILNIDRVFSESMFDFYQSN